MTSTTPPSSAGAPLTRPGTTTRSGRQTPCSAAFTSSPSAWTPTRPCIDSSGNFRVLSEVYDIHDYDQNTDTFQARWDGFTALAKERGSLSGDDPFFEGLPWGEHGKAPFFNQPYDGQPVFISEYGGIRWVENTVEGWGYGAAPRHRRGVFRPLQGPDRGPPPKSGDLRLLLHPALRHRAGDQRPVYLRPPGKVPHLPHPGDQPAARRHRGLLGRA